MDKKTNLILITTIASAALTGGLLYSETLFLFAAALCVLICISRMRNVSASPLLLCLVTVNFLYGLATIFFCVNRGGWAQGVTRDAVYLCMFFVFCISGDGKKLWKSVMDTLLYFSLYCFFINICALFMGMLPVVDGRRAFSLVIPYSNTLALLFSICAIYCLQRKKRLHYLFATVCFIGMLLTYSYIVIALTVLMLALLAAMNGKKIICIAVFAATILCGFLLCRHLPLTSLYERLIYWRDSIKIISVFPFGTGVQGWGSLYTMYQSGIYAVRYAHSSFVQTALDKGIFGIALFVAFTVIFIRLYRKSRKKDAAFSDGVLIISVTVFMHSLVDMDFEFPLMVMIMLCAAVSLAKTAGEETKLSIRTAWRVCDRVICTAFALLFVTFAVSQLFYVKGYGLYEEQTPNAAEYFEASVKWNSYNAESLYMLAQTRADREAIERASELDRYNPKYCAALLQFCTDDEEKIEVLLRLLELQPMNIDYYTQLSRLYNSAGEYANTVSLEDKFKKAAGRIDRLSHMARPSVSFEMPQELFENILIAKRLI